MLLSRRLLLPMYVAAMVFMAAPHLQAQETSVSKKPFARFSASAQALRDSAVAKARSQVGTRYKLGGTTPNIALDCSGLVKYVMGALDFILPRTANEQATVGQAIPKDLAAMKPGDLLTFGRGKRISHIGIYIGDGKMIHASTSKRQVIETAVSTRNPLIRQWQGVRRLVTGLDSLRRDSMLAIADTLR
ncbi:MAG: C40 family peptidase [Gemmatimonadaceae bacterium]|nr:C40 family peptidase [Gemmatimonadaceae bacterium]